MEGRSSEVAGLLAEARTCLSFAVEGKACSEPVWALKVTGNYCMSFVVKLVETYPVLTGSAGLRV